MDGEVTYMCHILRGRCEPWWWPQSYVLGVLVSFSEFLDFSRFPCTTWGSSTAPNGPGRIWSDPNDFWRWSGCTWCVRLHLEESGHPWVCLNGSRSFGLRHVLAGHPCRCWVGKAHGGLRIDVEVVREIARWSGNTLH